MRLGDSLESQVGMKRPGLYTLVGDEGKSLRQRYASHNKLGKWNTNKHSIEWLELSISNDCNLMCRMCDSKYSHKLFDEELEYYGKTQAKTKRTKMNIESIFPMCPLLNI